MKFVSRSAFCWAVSTLLCASAWSADPAIVFVDEAKAGAKSIMVMDEDGTNRSEVFRTEKQFCDCSGPRLAPSISPSGSSIAYSKGDIYRIAVDGGEPQMLLCSEGSGHLVALGTPQWSPSGTEIAVHFTDYFAALQAVVIIPQDGLECGIPPEVIYSEPEGMWEIYKGIAWSQNGSLLALLEVDLVELVDYLTILDRTTREVTRYPIDWPPGVLGGNVVMQLEGLDWNRSGNLVLAFGSYEETPTGVLERAWLLTVEDQRAVADEIGQGQSPTWSPDGSNLLLGAPRAFSSPPEMTLVTLSTGESVPFGTGYDPDWKYVPLASCSSDADCGEGELCDSGNGICFVPECGALDLPACEDFNDCTVDTCVDYQCEFDPAAAAGLFCDDGDFCTEDDVCDGSGVCEGTLNTGIPGCEPPSCGAVGDSCTSGADCCSGSCHPRKGCR